MATGRIKAVLAAAFVCILFLAPHAAAEADATESVVIADFEGWPDNLGGDIGVYGSLEPAWDMMETVPYSWVYEPKTPGYTTENVHDGNKSFRLVTGTGTKPKESWGSFAMDMGPTVDIKVVPKKVKSFDASGFRYITFWLKGARGGEKMKVIMRDSHALDYMPQYKSPSAITATTEWQKIVIPLSRVGKSIDLKSIDNLGIAFGMDEGNRRGSTIYVDTFMFSVSK